MWKRIFDYGGLIGWLKSLDMFYYFVRFPVKCWEGKDRIMAALCAAIVHSLTP